MFIFFYSCLDFALLFGTLECFKKCSETKAYSHTYQFMIIRLQQSRDLCHQSIKHTVFLIINTIVVTQKSFSTFPDLNTTSDCWNFATVHISSLYRCNRQQYFLRTCKFGDLHTHSRSIKECILIYLDIFLMYQSGICKFTFIQHF